ncbi:MAG: 16S rRNA (uracil(1498)-N(3))-methyltransferase [Oscillospiraceae bacterium]|nr:16S rRNA (uracil(1498)-N(3))-methyltransferase [Oscillospiraceae bacterium]MBR6617856.1 16S rRNA (uracil(1498)-N(3))-methyltransferase [Oscillospiraceae bacterium]
MPRFFVEQANSDEIIITGEDAHHIGRSLRMRTGEQLTVCAEGMDYECEITRITDSEVYLKPLSVNPCAAEPSVKVTLYQAIPKNDKLSEIVQKAVELGACEIVPVLTSRCVSRPSTADFEKKRQRLQKIAVSAAKQSGRGIIPTVSPMLTWKQALQSMQAQDISVMLYEEEGGVRFGEVPLEGKHRIGLFIGSEGGISEEEAQQAVDAGLHRVWLGSRILRCETAPTAAISILMYLTKNL